MQWQHVAYGHSVEIKLCRKCKDFMDPNIPQSFTKIRRSYLDFVKCTDCKIERTTSHGHNSNNPPASKTLRRC